MLPAMLAVALLVAQQPEPIEPTPAQPAPVPAEVAQPAATSPAVFERDCVREVYAVRLADETIADEMRAQIKLLEQERSVEAEARVQYAAGALVVGIAAGALLGSGVLLFTKGFAQGVQTP